MCHDHLNFLVNHNKLRLSLLNEKNKEANNGPSVCPRMAHHRADGLFDPSISGCDALEALCNFQQESYVCRPQIEVDDRLSSMFARCEHCKGLQNVE